MIVLNLVELYSNSIHSQQIITGLIELEKNGLIKIKKVTFVPIEKNKHFFGEPFVKVYLNHKVILFDTADSFELPSNIDIVKNVNYIFKRSYRNEGYLLKDIVVMPLGFNYLVYNSDLKLRFFIEEMKASFFQKNALHFFATRLNIVSRIFNINSSRFNLSLDKLVELDFSKRKGIIYNTRLWNPSNAKNKDETIRREILNNKRIKVVRELKSVFGSDFAGGIYTDDYSKKNCSENLLLDNSNYSRRIYLNNLRQSKIGISINGNHSAGYAFGEYISMGLAVVCDKINNKLPGEFIENKNYLEIDDDISNISSIINKILEDETLYKTMVLNNFSYYFNNLKPDILVLNAFLNSI